MWNASSYLHRRINSVKLLGLHIKNIRNTKKLSKQLSKVAYSPRTKEHNNLVKSLALYKTHLHGMQWRLLRSQVGIPARWVLGAATTSLLSAAVAPRAAHVLFTLHDLLRVITVPSLWRHHLEGWMRACGSYGNLISTGATSGDRQAWTVTTAWRDRPTSNRRILSFLTPTVVIWVDQTYSYKASCGRPG